VSTGARNFFLMSHTSSGHTQWLQEFFSRGVKRPELEAGHSLPYAVEVLE
jgi:hypothetical protein